jgi:hypothetical protein
LEKVKYESNVDFKAMMYLKVPQREQEEEIPIELSQKDGEEPPEEGAVQTVIRMVDEDQQGKALAIITRNPANMQGDQLLQINQYAGQCYRESFIEFIH